MTWRNTMFRVLPPIQNTPPHITSPFGAVYKRPAGSTNPHKGVDFNYDVPGQQGQNMKHPMVYAPVDGVVTSAGEGTVGRIAIRDANGFSHEILHTQERHVSVGDRVTLGQPIGTMGNTGTHDQHVHYQLKDPDGRTIDPMAFWDQRNPAEPNPADGDTVRRLMRVSGPTATALTDMAATPVTPFNVIPPDRPASFDDRFGDWASSPQVTAPRGPYQPEPPRQGNRLPGIVSGKPMPDYPFPPPIWDFPDKSAASEDDSRDWLARLLQSIGTY